jgi:hypothetical protein
VSLKADGSERPPIKTEAVLVGEQLEAYAEFKAAANAAAEAARANDEAQRRFRSAMDRLCRSVAPVKDGG